MKNIFKKLSIVAFVFLSSQAVFATCGDDLKAIVADVNKDLNDREALSLALAELETIRDGGRDCQSVDEKAAVVKVIADVQYRLNTFSQNHPYLTYTALVTGGVLSGVAAVVLLPSSPLWMVALAATTTGASVDAGIGYASGFGVVKGAAFGATTALATAALSPMHSRFIANYRNVAVARNAGMRVGKIFRNAHGNIAKVSAAGGADLAVSFLDYNPWW